MSRYLICKGGAYYRPNAEGYTRKRAEAGRYTLDEAMSHSHPNGPNGPRDGITYEPEFSASKHEPEPHRADCGNCYGNGCGSCGGKGTVETQAGREAREEWEDGAYDRDRDDRMMEGGR